MRIFSLLFATILTTIGCHDAITTIKGCCDEPAASAIFGNGKIFVPNVFTPNGDGLNDLLTIYGDSALVRIFKVKNKDKVTVYEIFDFPLNRSVHSWDGEFAGTIEQGLYSFVVEAEAYDGTATTLKGKVCICPCIAGIDEDFIPLSGCNFGTCILHEYDDCHPIEYLPCFEQ